MNAFWAKELIRLDPILTDHDKADILLVWSGFKPAAMVELSYSPKAAFSRKEFYKKIRDLEKTLNKLSLIYQLHLSYPKNTGELTQYSYIAKDNRTLRKLISADSKKDKRRRRLQVGALLGYPKTAVEAFANGTILRRLPPSALKRKELKFLDFRLSKHWREEFGYVKKRAQTIKRIAPELYKRISGAK